MNRFLPLLLLLCSVTCTIIPDNLADPQNPNYVLPYMIIDSTGVYDGDTIFTDTVILSITGNLPDKNEYRYRLDTLAWSSWKKARTAPQIRIALGDADTGKHILSIQNCYNPNSEVSDTAIAFVKVNPPHFIMTSDTVISTAAGQALKMWAKASGTKPIVYQWYLNDSIKTWIEKDTLAIDSITVAAQGTYFCIAQSRWGADTSNRINVTITPATINHKPVFGAYSANVTDTTGKAIVLTFVASDSDGNALTFSMLDTAAFMPGEITHISTATTMTVTVTPADAVNHVVKVQVSDGITIATAMVTVSVIATPAPIAPVFAAYDSTFSAKVGIPLTLRLRAIDANGDRLAYSLPDSAKFSPGEISSSLRGDTLVVIFTPAAIGLDTIRIVASDGNLLVAARIYVDAKINDMSPPSLRLLDKALDSSSINTNSMLVEVIAKDNDRIDSVTASLGNVVKKLANPHDSLWSTEMGGLVNGAFTTISIHAWDLSGNSADVTLTVKYDATMLDNINPRIVLVGIGSVVADSVVTIVARVTDGSGIATVTIDGNTVTSNDSLYNKSTRLNKGGNNVTVYAKDKSANANDTTIVFPIIYDPTSSDTIGPTISLLSPANNANLTATPVVVKVVLTDASGVASATINSISATRTDSIFSAPVALIDGNNPIQVTAQDSGYNRKTSTASYNLKLDLPPAAVTVNTPTGPATTTTGLTINWSQSDANDFVLYKVFYATTPNVTDHDAQATAISIKVNTSFALTGLTPNTTYFFKVYVCDGASCVAGNEVSGTTLPPPPTITTQSSSQTKCVGEPVAFNVATTGVSPLTYQWKKGTTNVGTNQDTYAISAVATGDAGSYTCTVSNAGGSVTTSPVATLTVNTLSSVTLASANPPSVSSDAPSSTLTVSGTLGTGATWKWFTGSCGGTPVGAVPSISLIPTATTMYYVRAEGGTCGGNTECVPVTVVYNPTVTFDDQGGTIAANPSSKVALTPPGNIGSLPEPPKKTGYAFDGWYTEPKGKGTPFSANTTVTTNKTVYANWVAGCMVKISAAGQSFSMGLAAVADTLHTVTFTYNYWMDTTEVTQIDYQNLLGKNPSTFSGDHHPVESITWFDAVLYCNKRSLRDGKDTVYTFYSISGEAGNGCTGLGGLGITFTANGYRLPTEAEWEYACRAGSTSTYYWGEAADDATLNLYEWFNSNSNNTSHDVAGKNPNNYNLYDMGGNVYEWCNDWYDIYRSQAQTDPIGPSIRDSRVARGGMWRVYPAGSADRGSLDPMLRSFYCGFRCACPR
jgi:uncharacterized repeat protein (TIGR02543 family)